MPLTDIIGAWFAAFLTLSILSFLFKENPLFKAAEHLFAGASAGYGVVVAYWDYIRPNLIYKLWPQKENIAEHAEAVSKCLKLSNSKVVSTALTLGSP